MKPSSLLVLMVALASQPVATAQTNLSPPAFPPKDWSLLIQLDLSKDLMNQFLEKKPDKNDFTYIEGIRFWLDSKGGVTAPRKHPVLTGKLPGNNIADH